MSQNVPKGAQCQDCRWMGPASVNALENYGTCFLRPPVVHKGPTALYSVRPEVHYTDVCASWESSR